MQAPLLLKQFLDSGGGTQGPSGTLLVSKTVISLVWILKMYGCLTHIFVRMPAQIT